MDEQTLNNRISQLTNLRASHTCGEPLSTIIELMIELYSTKREAQRVERNAERSVEHFLG